MERRLDILGVGVQLFFAHDARLPDLAHYSALVANSFDDVARAGFTFCTDKGGAFGYATEGLSKVTCAADKRNFECVLVNVVFFIGGRENFRLVNVVDADGL